MRKAYDFTQGKRGPVVPLAPVQTRITIHLGSGFREKVNQRGDSNYQTMINEALGACVQE
jgi:hypothetical protein